MSRLDLEHIGDVVGQNNIQSRKRAASHPDLGNEGLKFHQDPINGVQVDDDELTIGEQLASLNTMNIDDGGSHEHTEASLSRKPPSADSVHVLLKQALHADDRSLLLDCLFRQDEKIITNSVACLNPSNVFKLLDSLISMIQSRGAVVACALPWLKSLLLQHSSSIMCQESSLIGLSSLYQLIESRISTCNPALQLSSCLDLLYTKGFDDEEREGSLVPIIYDDESETDEEDAMESEEELEPVSNVSDLERSDDMNSF